MGQLALRQRFDELSKPLRPMLFKIALRILHGKEEAAEEAVQNTYLKAYEDFIECPEKFEGTLGSKAFTPWMIVVLRNACIDILRRLRRFEQSHLLFDMRGDRKDGGFLDFFVCEPGDVVLNEVYFRSVLRALREGKPQHVTPLLLHVLGWTYAEIAERLGLGEDNITMRIYRRRAKLRRLDI